MKGRIRMPGAALLALLMSAVVATAASAQGGEVLHGRVLDPDGKPVAGQDVALHRVTQAGGAMVGTTRTGPDGRFDLNIPPSAPADSAVFFVAARYQGQLYIGQPFRPPLPSDAEYDVTVGVGAVTPGPLGGAGASGSTLPAAPDGGAATGSGLPRELGAGLLALIAVVGLGWALMARLRERRVRSNRELLVQIARLDEARQTDGRLNDPDYRRRRAALVARFEAAARR